MKNCFLQTTTVIKLIIALFVVNLFGFCSSADLDTDITIISLKTDIENDTVINYDVVSYLFDADTATHYFATYNEAEQGIIRVKNSKRKQSYIMSALSNHMGYINYRATIKNNLVTVVCDAETQLYYYRNVALNVNLPNIYLKLVMNPEMFIKNPDTLARSGSWTGSK